jgi:predicted nucleic acid-binding protein
MSRIVIRERWSRRDPRDLATRSFKQVQRRLAVLGTAHVPDLFDSEVMNVVRHRHLAGRFDDGAVAEIIAHLRAGQFSRHPVRALLDDMWTLHDDLTMYDAAYVALAARLGLPLVTVDQKLAMTPQLPCKVEVY